MRPVSIRTSRADFRVFAANQVFRHPLRNHEGLISRMMSAQDAEEREGARLFRGEVVYFIGGEDNPLPVAEPVFALDLIAPG